MKQTCWGNQPIKLIIAQSNISIAQGGFKYKLNNGVCTIIPYPTVEEKHNLQVYVTNELKKIVLFLYYMRHGMNFHSCRKHILKSFGCNKIRNDSK